ncbi:MAG TPA: thioesterase [Desulfobulbaceae bacterium]|nr:thioesterase [Desulfobulbaceae bacterium]
MEGYTTRIKVRGYHTDFYGHVNNTRYLEFYEEDRWYWLEKTIDLTELMKKGLAFAVVNINVSYRRPVFVGSTIEIRSRLDKVGSHSATLRQEIFLAGTDKLVSDALVTFVITGKEGKALNMNADVPELRELIAMMKAMSASGDKRPEAAYPASVN